MRKYAFLVHPADYAGFLDELRALGVLHVQRKKDLPPEEELSEYERRLKDVESALKLITSRKKNANNGESKALEHSGPEIAMRIWATQEEMESKKQQLSVLVKELQGMAPWGEFDLDHLKHITAAGWACSFFVCPTRNFDKKWEEGPYLFVVNELPPDTYFVVLHRPDEAPDIDAEPMPPPLHDPENLRDSIGKLKARITELEDQLDHFSVNAPALEAVRADLQEETDKEQVLKHSTDAADGAVMVLEGFVPRPVEEKLKAAFDSRPLIYWAEDPRPEDRPPVLLKNNAFSKFFEPISKLFALPSYGELDLTPFFAPFFMLFFGFCLGDAGYGLVILLGTLLYRSRAKEELKPYLTLAHFFGLATILFGILTGTVFGLNLLEGEYAWAANMRRFMIDSQQAFNLALILGLVQTIFGLVLQAINRMRRYHFAYGLPPIGWIILLLSLLDIGMTKAAVPYSTWTAWSGVALIVFFSMPKGNILSRFGKGLWDLYGISGFFGDLLSYVRLFALGISSAILGFVINDIALQIKDFMPVLGPILFVLFLVVGHGGNLLISSLGSFVHPMRLTFVEFYKNAGFEGGGKAYEPFASRKKQKSNITQNS